MTTRHIDIIVPVYNAAEDLAVCVESVIRHGISGHRLILIDDASPDPRIAEYFSRLAGECRPDVLLLKNEHNLGFVGTVNRGMALSDHDVILLNSDTIVTHDWIQKIVRCAESDPSIGTITPFSNNAEICSFPEFCVDNKLASLPDIELINRAIEAAAIPEYPDIPTAVGFCMYIRRLLIDRIGFFDAETFGKGYGEENDFCMRAVSVGYRNVLCDDTFVAHTGSRSFDQAKQALADENIKKLVAKHPSYLKLVRTFIEADPLKPVRKLAETTLRRLGATQRPGVLHILHSRQGGTENQIRDLIEGDRRRANRYRHYLATASGDTWHVEDIDGQRIIAYELRRLADEPWSEFLNGILDTLGVSLCHIHHMAGARLGLLQALSAQRVPYGVSLHDSYLACPTINLLDKAGVYCEGCCDPIRCQSCLDAQPMFASIVIKDWRAQHRELLENAKFIVAPSNWQADIYRRYFPGLSITVVPHGLDVSKFQELTSDDACSALLLPHDGCTSIGVLGAIGPVKGARRLESLVARTKARNLPLRWVVIGYLDTQYQPWQDRGKWLTVHGPYKPQHLTELLDHYRIDLLVFPSSGPESFSYTLSEAWLCGRPALVPPIGALGERVHAYGGGWIMNDWQNDDAILDQLVSILASNEPTSVVSLKQRVKDVPTFTIEEMAQQTLDTYPAIFELCDTPGVRNTLSKLRFLDAVRPEANTDKTSLSLRYRFVRKVLGYALQFRHTGIGLWLYRTIPLSWQRSIKALLMART